MSTVTKLQPKKRVITRADEDGQFALRTIQLAIEHGWSDEAAAALARRGRAAIVRRAWTATADLDSELIMCADTAFEWLAGMAVPDGWELINLPHRNVLVLTVAGESAE